MRRLSGLPVSDAILDRVRARVEAGRGRGHRRPSLVSLFRDVPSSPFRFYARQQEKAARACGFTFRAEALARDVPAGELRGRMRALNADPEVDAVLVEHPLPPEMDFDGAVSELRPEKDTDGVGAINLGYLLIGRPLQVPAVALASLEILRYHGIPIAGRRVGVVGRSPTVGLPIALLASGKETPGNASVTLVHSQSGPLKTALANVEIVFVGIGQPNFLTREHVPEGVVVVDVGLSSVPDASRPSGTRAAGDADAASLEGWASAITPVPGGVGPVTVAELMANVVHGWELLHGGDSTR
ncbi:MAG TPA: bifunctional 5,10-methylenetetrahydrofolate dehydrogenase/5,10-methenyltetrahydrofolate cyclohydrolase [Thermoplasmata archaeon]|nr:bifunctional 5,10-methylenetetrahydrofolate dehydrogenase/5,10-methenyltetrahydrofolate cyclohydrolase [Thermoplasmata archaeon]